MDNREDYEYGWNERGERFYALKSGKRSGRVNMIAVTNSLDKDGQPYTTPLTVESQQSTQEGCPSLSTSSIGALCDQKLLAPFTVEGACNRTVFETWLEKCLVPVLRPGQVIVMDNATFHKGGRIEQLIQKAGCLLLSLPSYSPDLNQIEKCWSWLKSRIRKQLKQFDCLRDAMEFVLRQAS